MFESLIAGQAIKITAENAQLIAVVNKGVAPAYEGFYTGSYFVVPNDPNAHATILPGYVFTENFAAWNPTDYPLNDQFFVEIVEI